jgi:hypothetical protein
LEFKVLSLAVLTTALIWLVRRMRHGPEAAMERMAA